MSAVQATLLAAAVLVVCAVSASEVDFLCDLYTNSMISDTSYLQTLWSLHVSGTIPKSFNQLRQLTFLNMKGMHLTGTIPREIGQLTKLQYLRLCKNQLSGTLPDEMANMTSLRELYLMWNRFSALNPKWANLPNLEILEISHTPWNMTIPAEFGNFPSLTYLGLGNGGLIGTIPPSLGNLTSLKYLLLHHNRLSGTYPPELGGPGHLPNLEKMSLTNNLLTGTLPRDLSGLKSCKQWDVYTNLLQGEMVPNMFGMTTQCCAGWGTTASLAPARAPVLALLTSSVISQTAYSATAHSSAWKHH